MNGVKKTWKERRENDTLRPPWLGLLVLIAIIIIFIVFAYGYLTRP